MENEKVFGSFPDGFMWGTATASYQTEGFYEVSIILLYIGWTFIY